MENQLAFVASVHPEETPPQVETGCVYQVRIQNGLWRCFSEQEYQRHVQIQSILAAEMEAAGWSQLKSSILMMLPFFLVIILLYLLKKLQDKWY